MANRRLKVLFITGLLACSAAAAQAQSLPLPPSDLFQVSTSAGKVMCGKVSNRFVPGTLAKDGTTFTRLKTTIAVLNKRIKKAKGNAKTKLEKQRATAVKREAAARKKCAEGQGGGGTPTPAPTSGPNPNPTPTRTPTPAPTSSACFNGNTARGGCFGIPTNMTGDLARGSSLWISRSCMGCHAASGKLNRTYSQIQASFSTQPNMAGLPTPSSQELADYAAYLNRFNLP